jgi:hypothetical protein
MKNVEFDDEIAKVLGIKSKGIELGSGQFGQIYAVEGDDDFIYALKVVESNNFNKSEWKCGKMFSAIIIFYFYCSIYRISGFGVMTLSSDCFFF